MMRVWWHLSDVCLSVAYIGPKSRTERPRKTKIGTEVAHVTLDSDTTFKVKRSKVKVTGAEVYCGGLPHSLFKRLVCWMSAPVHLGVGYNYAYYAYYNYVSWRRSIVVRTLVSAGELSLSCAGLLAGCVTTLRLSRPLSVSQHSQLSHPSLRGR